MPRISYFYGIAVYMYYADHAPPHFHVIYAEFEAEIEISSGTVRAGRLPRRAHRLVRKWLASYNDQLLADWERARDGLPLRPIAPLE